MNQATVAVCNGGTFFNIFYSAWYCQKSSLARSFVTGILPSVLLMLWQNLVMPTAVYRCASAVVAPIHSELLEVEQRSILIDL